MPNTLGTTNGLIVAQRTLETLLVQFPVLSLITTDFSAEVKRFGQEVVTRVVSPTTASDYDPVNGYVPTPRAVVDVSVTINKHKHHTYDVNDQERTSTNRDLIQEWADTAAHALGTAVVNDLTSLVTPTNFNVAGQQSVITAANFNRSSVVAIRTALNKRFVPDVGRFMVLNSDYAGALADDTTIVANLYNRDANTISSGQLPPIHGFQIAEYSALPDNGVNLTGFGGNKEALVIATRLPDLPSPDVPLGGTIDVVTEPHTGLSIQLRQWYNFQLGQEFRTITLMYGMAVNTGAPGRLQLITSA